MQAPRPTSSDHRTTRARALTVALLAALVTACNQPIAPKPGAPAATGDTTNASTTASTRSRIEAETGTNPDRRLTPLSTVNPGATTNAWTINDVNASGGQAVMLPATGSTVRFTLPSDFAAGSYVVRAQARGQYYLTWPTVDLRLNGTRVTGTAFDTSTYAAQTFTTLNLKAGDALDFVFTNDEYGGSSDKDRNAILDYVLLDPIATTSSTTSATGITGLTSGSTVSGTVQPGPGATPATGTSVDNVTFKLNNAAGQTVKQTTERTAPYCFLGDNGSTCNAFDTRAYADGGYTLSAVTTRTDGSSSTAAVSFKVANGTSGTGGTSTSLPTGDVYVSASAASGGTGSATSPLRTITDGVNRASSGQTVVVMPGTYRETVTIGKSLKLVGADGAIVKGSDVWTGWTQEGAYFTKPYSFSFYQQGNCQSTSNGRCRLPDAVFVDGRAQFQETALSNVGAGEFYVGNGKIYLGSNPSGHTVEVATRTKWVAGANNAGNVTVKGLTFRQLANSAQRGGIEDSWNATVATSGSNWVIDGNDVGYASGAGIRTDGYGAIVRNNNVHDNGEIGMTGTGSNMRIENNRISGNNTEQFSTGWEAGGTKWGGARNLVVIGNESDHNDGPGLWCDVNCSNVQFLNNRVHDNTQQGISFEISDGCVMDGNTAYGNGFGFPNHVWGAGLLVSTSSNCEIKNNLVAWNADGISVTQQNRGTSSDVTGVNVHDNTIIAKGATALLAWFSDTSTQTLFNSSSNNRGSNNRYYADPNGGVAQWMWKTQTSSLSTFNASLGEENGTLISATTAAGILSTAGVPTTSPR